MVHSLPSASDAVYGGWGKKPAAYQPLDASRQLPRAEGVLLHRVRLGYRTREELYDGFQGQECFHYGRHYRQSLLHYLLSCPAIATLRLAQSPSAYPDSDGLLTQRETRATLLVRHTPVDVMLHVLWAAPPPC